MTLGLVIRGLEILEMRDEGEYLLVRTALHGRPAKPLDIHKSVRERYRDDDEFEAYLARLTRTMLDVFGDAREGREEPAEEFVV